jgi:hypothetical protein
MLPELSPESARWTSSFQELGCESSRDLVPLDIIIGQERAIPEESFNDLVDRNLKPLSENRRDFARLGGGKKERAAG